jgi:hypothetical protein
MLARGRRGGIVVVVEGYRWTDVPQGQGDKLFHPDQTSCVHQIRERCRKEFVEGT